MKRALTLAELLRVTCDVVDAQDDETRKQRLPELLRGIFDLVEARDRELRDERARSSRLEVENRKLRASLDRAEGVNLPDVPEAVGAHVGGPPG